MQWFFLANLPLLREASDFPVLQSSAWCWPDTSQITILQLRRACGQTIAFSQIG